MREDGVGEARSRPQGRVERRRTRTREQLTSAARTLIATRGLSSLTIGDVTEAADIGHGSFYSHFESKESLVEAVLNDSLQTLAALAISIVPEHDDPAVAACVADRRFIRTLAKDRELARLLISAHDAEHVFVAATLPYARAVLEPGLQSGRFDVPDVDVALLIGVGSLFTLLRAILDGDAPAEADRAHAESMLRLFGLSAAEARAIGEQPFEDV
jgi:AcrR family transcriptional regulator